MRVTNLSKICTVLIVIIITFTYFVTPIFGATPSQLKQQIEARNAQIAEIEEEIKALGKDIAVTSQERLTLENKLRQIEQERQHLLKELDLTATKIERTDLTINSLNNEISDKQKKINLQKKNIGNIIRRVHEQDQYSIIELLVTEEQLSDVWQEIDALLTLQDSSRRHIRQLQGLQVELRGNIEEKEEQKDELESLKQEIESQKQIVELNKQEQAELVSITKNKEDSYQALLRQKQAQRAAFEAEIREYESQLEFLSNPNALPARGSAPLSWPLDAIVVTQLFGAKTGPHRTYANGHSGTDFRARTPVKLYAMADGVVMGTGNTDLACPGVSFGKWIAIEHDNNLVSTSAHLSVINVKKGDRVQRGQVIGYTGNTGRSTAPHLHISLYAGLDANGKNPVNVGAKPSRSCSGAILTQPTAPIDAYLDVLDYLPPLNQSLFKSSSDYYQYQQ
jgi:murein DD-endopeptidase MepM/ murein hydrolase activator NlpD